MKLDTRTCQDLLFALWLSFRQSLDVYFGWIIPVTAWPTLIPSHLCVSMHKHNQAQTFLFWTPITPIFEKRSGSLRGGCVSGNISSLERVKTWGQKSQTCPSGVLAWEGVCNLCIRPWCVSVFLATVSNVFLIGCWNGVKLYFPRDEAAVAGAHSGGQWWAGKVEPDGGAGPGDSMLCLPQNWQRAQERERGLGVPQNIWELPPQRSLRDKVRLQRHWWI